MYESHIVVFHINGSFVRYLVHIGAKSIVASNNAVFVSSLFDFLVKYDMNLNLITYIFECNFTRNDEGPCLGGELSLFYDKSSGRLYCADPYVNAIHVFDTDLNRITFHTPINMIFNVLYYNNIFYESTVGNRLNLMQFTENGSQFWFNSFSVCESTLVVEHFRTIYVHEDEYFLFPCYYDKTIRIFHLNMTFANLVIPTLSKPLAFTFGPGRQLLVTTKNPTGIEIYFF